MKTPLTYYGGKQRLATTIVELLPEHDLYCEPFVGGGAVFFNKPASRIEVINDINSELINFYEVVKRDFVAIEQEIQISLHSRDLHRKATTIYQNPDMFERTKRAWAVWYLSNTAFGGMLNGSFGYGIENKHGVKLHNKRDSFTQDLAIRLQEVQIECADALRIIRSRDSANSFFYCDPPYINCDQGHYDGYTVEDYKMLLETLASIKGKFLLSSYKNEPLTSFTRTCGWSSRTIEVALLGANNKNTKRQRRFEVLTANYPIADSKSVEGKETQ